MRHKMTSEWKQDFIIYHNGMVEKDKLKEFTFEIFNRIQKLSDGFWKPVALSYNENEIKITCEYVEGVRYG